MISKSPSKLSSTNGDIDHLASALTKLSPGPLTTALIATLKRSGQIIETRISSSTSSVTSGLFDRFAVTGAGGAFQHIRYISNDQKFIGCQNQTIRDLGFAAQL